MDTYFIIILCLFSSKRNNPNFQKYKRVDKNCKKKREINGKQIWQLYSTHAHTTHDISLCIFSFIFRLHFLSLPRFLSLELYLLLVVWLRLRVEFDAAKGGEAELRTKLPEAAASTIKTLDPHISIDLYKFFETFSADWGSQNDGLCTSIPVSVSASASLRRRRSA